MSARIFRMSDFTMCREPSPEYGAKPRAVSRKVKRKSAESPAVEFLRAATAPGANGTVIAIDPEKAQGDVGQIAGCAYTVEAMEGAAAFIEAHVKQRHNLYWSPNPTRSPLNKKPQKADIAMMQWAHLDFDDASDAALKMLREYPAPPTMIVFSGGGYNAYWQLQEPVYANGNIAELEAVNRKLIADFGGDKGTHNLDRILRLPGTTNWPTKTKIARGRTPIEAQLIEHHIDRTYSLSQLAAVEYDAPDPEPPKGKKGQPSPPDGKKGGDRSRELLRKISDAIRKGLSDDEIHERFDKDEHALDQANPARAVQRCIQKIRNEASDVVEQVNAENALIWVSGKLLVMWHREFEDSGLPRLSKIGDAKAYWKKAQRGKTSPIDLWLGSNLRNEYRGFTFQPGKEDTGDMFNLFRGWGVKPDPEGDCSLFLAHLREVICKGDDDLNDYVTQWLANSVQTPMEKPGTALAISSGQGSGKGLIDRYLTPIYGTHMKHAGSSEQLLGKFNAWLSGKILVFGDESAWPSDRRGQDKLKHQITEEIITVEEKNLPVFEIKNFARYIFATNSRHSAHAEVDDRRYVTLDASNAHADDRPYWDALEAERKGRGPAALLHYLLNVKLTRDLRSTPKTISLAEQKLLSLDDVGKFVRHLMYKQKHMIGTGPDPETGAQRVVALEWGEVIGTEMLHKAYLAFAKSNNLKYTLSLDALGLHLKKYFEFAKREPREGERERLGLPKRYRGYIYALPTLVEARASFAATLKQDVPWPAWQEPTE